jgi:hypothetical protein
LTGPFIEAWWRAGAKRAPPDAVGFEAARVRFLASLYAHLDAQRSIAPGNLPTATRRKRRAEPRFRQGRSVNGCASRGS